MAQRWVAAVVLGGLYACSAGGGADARAGGGGGTLHVDGGVEGVIPPATYPFALQ